MLRRDVILHVEDDKHYSELLNCAFQQAGFRHRLINFTNAVEAREYLQGIGKFSDRLQYPLPGLALVDLKMPGMDGFELLQWIRQKSTHPFLPVVVLTSSDELRDVRKAYQLGANSFLTKPPRPEDLKEMIRMIEGFWVKFNIVSPDA